MFFFAPNALIFGLAYIMNDCALFRIYFRINLLFRKLVGHGRERAEIKIVIYFLSQYLTRMKIDFH